MTPGAPLCFILMPFGKKPNADGALIDFDRVYGDLIAPAITDAGLQPLRADQETTGGIIHKPMFERLILCPFAVADLTLANANVYYELGIRHAFRPWSTIQIVAEGSRLPFDVQMLRTIFYKLGADGVPDATSAARVRETITTFLNEARKGTKDSPIFQLLDNITEPILQTTPDVFREQIDYATKTKDKLALARNEGADSVRKIEKELGNIADVEAGILIDLLLSYRGTSAWSDMIELATRMPAPLAQTALVREQLAFALNRMKRRNEAEQLLLKLIEEKGPSSETYGLLGRVYKDRWEEEAAIGNPMRAQGYLDKAIDTYLAGFESDWRDAYPGVNALTLMELREPPDERRKQILPVVRYSVERKIAKGKAGYWDFATLLELAVLSTDQAEAEKMLAKALAAVSEKREPETTVHNLRLIRATREKRGPVPEWQKEVEDLLARGQSE